MAKSLQLTHGKQRKDKEMSLECINYVFDLDFSRFLSRKN